MFSNLLSGTGISGSDITAKLGVVGWDLDKLINQGDMNVSSFWDNDKNSILDLNSQMRKEYLSNSVLGGDKDIQNLIKKSRERYESGDIEGFIKGEDGKMFTKEGILFGRLGKDGNLGEVSNSDVFLSLIHI